jgi:hypothetical protein
MWHNLIFKYNGCSIAQSLNRQNMINLKETTKILNAGNVKYSQEEVLAIRDFLISLAQIEYNIYITSTSNNNQ